MWPKLDSSLALSMLLALAKLRFLNISIKQCMWRAVMAQRRWERLLPANVEFFWFSEGFLRCSLVYLPLQKPTSPNSNSTKIEDPWKPAKPDIWPPLWIFLLVLKCLWNEFFAYFSEKLKSMILWFGIFELILRRSAYEFFLLLRSCPIRVKMCHIPRAVKICKLLQLTSQGV